MSLRFLHPEAPRVPSQPPPVARPGLQVPPHHRILLGGGAALGQARIQIGGGRLAGSEIHLSVNGSHVEACLLTSHQASRQTLVTAMEGARQRLRERGLVLRTAVTAPGARDGQSRDPDRAARGARPR